MEIQQIRNATNKIKFGGVTFLLDPWLADKGSMGSFDDISQENYQVPDPVKMVLPMPFYGLPLSREKIREGVDAYIVTHIHPDHIDVAADGTVGKFLDKTVPVFVQNETDAAVFRKSGFQRVQVLSAEGTVWKNVTLSKVPAKHGTMVSCGNAMGVVFQAQGEKTLYVSGDTVWYPGVKQTLEAYSPEVVTVNACAAELVGFGRLIMNDEDVECVARTVPRATIFITHMDNVAHASLTRYDMKGRLAGRGVTNYVMPQDGETVLF